MTSVGAEVLLLASPGPGDGPSMHRYAQELYAALTNLPRFSGRVAVERPTATPLLSRFVDHRQARRLDDVVLRYVSYPRAVRHRRAGVFHILDQGYAHLIRSIDPERTVITCHDVIPLLAAEGAIQMSISPTVARSFRWRVGHLRRARKIIAVSAATKMTLERYAEVAPERIVVIPQGVSQAFRVITHGRTTTRALAGVGADMLVVLQIATRARYKNTPALLQALAQLRREVTQDVTLVRIGAPFFPEEIDLASRLDVTGHIRHLGWVDEDTLARWYNAADVLAFPSLCEGFGWPPLEAMACGTPVVASDVPAVAEVVQDAGLLVPADDPGALARAIGRVLTEMDLAQSLRQKGLARAAEFTWARTALATAALYEEVLQ